MTNVGEGRGIPERIKREVRKRCGFGCVECGVPIIEYHHMTEWAKVHAHVAADITLLCPNHHAEATKGLFTEEAVRAADRDPFALRAGTTSPHGIRYSGDSIQVHLGSNQFVSTSETDTEVVRMLGEPLLSVTFEDGRPLVNLIVYDADGCVAVRVERNELIFRADLWDVTFAGRKLAVRETRGRIALICRFEPPADIFFDRIDFVRGGERVRIEDGVIILPTGARLEKNIERQSPVGIDIWARLSERVPASFSAPSAAAAAELRAVRAERPELSATDMDEQEWLRQQVSRIEKSIAELKKAPLLGGEQVGFGGAAFLEQLRDRELALLERAAEGYRRAGPQMM